MRKTLKSQVEWCLRNMPETRDSDVTLLLAVWKRFHESHIRVFEGVDWVRTKDLYNLPREDAVKRIRALFNQEGKYFPTSWEVAKVRGLKEEEWRQKLGYPMKFETKESSRKASYMDPEKVEPVKLPNI